MQWAPADRGACYHKGLAEQAIKVSHFGLHATNNSIDLGDLYSHNQMSPGAQSRLPGPGQQSAAVVCPCWHQMLHRHCASPALTNGPAKLFLVVQTTAATTR